MQEFKPEGYSYVVSIPFLPCSIYRKGLIFKINYRGEEFKSRRDEFSIRTHGMTWEETQRPENAHLFVAKIYSYKTS